MTYTLYYASQDVALHGDVLDTWAVYAEKYDSIDAHEPIVGSTVYVSGNHTEMEAISIAQARQRASYSENRRANHGT